MNNIRSLLMKISVIFSLLFVLFPIYSYGATSDVLKTISSNFMFSFVSLIILAITVSIVVHLIEAFIKKLKQ